MDKLVDISLSKAGTTRTRKNIIECLTKSLKSKYGITDKETLKEKVNRFMDLHGLGEDNFDPLAIISKLISIKLDFTCILSTGIRDNNLSLLNSVIERYISTFLKVPIIR